MAPEAHPLARLPGRAAAPRIEHAPVAYLCCTCQVRMAPRAGHQAQCRRVADLWLRHADTRCAPCPFGLLFCSTPDLWAQSDLPDRFLSRGVSCKLLSLARGWACCGARTHCCMSCLSTHTAKPLHGICIWCIAAVVVASACTAGAAQCSASPAVWRRSRLQHVLGERTLLPRQVCAVQ